jgi:itaconate CoA-transferase
MRPLEGIKVIPFEHAIAAPFCTRQLADSRRAKNRKELAQIILAAFSTLTAAQVIERLEAAGIANARMNDMHAVWEHEQLAARRRWTKVQTPAGEIPALYPPGVDPSDAPLMSDVPALGEHSEPILHESGRRKGDQLTTIKQSTRRIASDGKQYPNR